MQGRAPPLPGWLCAVLGSAPWTEDAFNPDLVVVDSSLGKAREVGPKRTCRALSAQLALESGATRAKVHVLGCPPRGLQLQPVSSHSTVGGWRIPSL